MQANADAGHAELLAAVDELAAAMKAKLNARREKNEGRLEDAPRDFFFQRLRDETDELLEAEVLAGQGQGPIAAVCNEAADVANFAMFVWVRRRRMNAAHEGWVASRHAP
jgi:hypothetical protein